MGLLGESIAYTKSPALHNAAALQLGLNIAYLPISLPRSDVANFLRLAWTMGAAGFNVTTPHKELVAKLLPGAGLDSVNTVYRGPKGWVAASTDGKGFALGLQRLGRSIDSFRRVVMLGAGGVTAALLAYMLRELATFPEVQVLRRDAGRDQQLLGALPPVAQSLQLIDWDPTNLIKILANAGEDTLLIQASSAPQKGDDLTAFVPALASFRGVVCDLVYAGPSALYRAARDKGLPAQDGAAMLIEQARLAQGLWWGRTVPYERLAEVLARV